MNIDSIVVLFRRNFEGINYPISFHSVACCYWSAEKIDWFLLFGYCFVVEMMTENDLYALKAILNQSGDFFLSFVSGSF